MEVATARIAASSSCCGSTIASSSQRRCNRISAADCELDERALRVPHVPPPCQPTTSVSDPDLVLDDRWLKLFTVFYLLIGIGILVEVLRRLGASFVAVRAAEERAADAD